VRRRFPDFSIYEHAFTKAYRFSNPFQICKKHLIQRGEDEVHAYGETPLPVLAKIAEECGLKRSDVLMELGCGRGRGVFFLSHLTGCRVIGVDWVPFFIRKANEVLGSGVPHLPISFYCEEMEKTDLFQATFIYLYGTCLSDQAIFELIDRFKKLSPSTKIITVSYPLAEYSPHFATLKQFSVVFPWGESEVYINSLV
jgi:hypothetical protein